VVKLIPPCITPVYMYIRHVDGRLCVDVLSRSRNGAGSTRTLVTQWGLLDTSTAQYFYKGYKTSLHKHTENLVENLFSTKCAFENCLQLLKLTFLSQTTTTL
jgi:hypothetical protein